MPLTDISIRNAKPGPKPYKLFDEAGLFLLLNPNGSKWWRLKYRFCGKERSLSLGIYPTVSLKEARKKRDENRRLLSDGVDPSAHRQARKAEDGERRADSFEALAREWHAKEKPNWSASHADRIIRRLERDIFPDLGKEPVADLTAPKLLIVLRKIEARGCIETSHRAMGNCSQILRYAIQTSRATTDIAHGLRGALQSVQPKHFPAVTDPKQVGELLSVIDGFQGTLIVRCAMRLAPLVFVRPYELRHALWINMDFEKAEWSFMATKTGIAHIVPLSTQALSILSEVQPLTGRGKYVFPSARGPLRPMSDNAILAAMRTLGIPQETMTGHGWRATARTLLDEELGFPAHLIEHQLGHRVRDPLGRAYNRTKHLPERKKMMQEWSNYLDKLKAGADVVPTIHSV